ncbi:type IV secretory system conjugative DNA transfer family protein [Thomasclavelia sp.]|uniref:type IV secretory system conjugative DNA transfer family protein n=1 Tax=Thomasclavelia sp. TaxID=3025757 RepID=UPI0025F62D10|nr:type IV secretory system conjugative DNA transfer family protein [Thomasclavelia sp.]
MEDIKQIIDFIAENPTLGIMLIMMAVVFIYSTFFSNKPNSKFTAGRIHKTHEARKYRSSIDDNNIVITKNIALGTDVNKTKNNFIMVIAGSGGGKTTSIIEPNLQRNMTLDKVINDTGDVLENKWHDYYIAHGYRVRVLDLYNFEGDCFNPLYYIRTRKGRLIKDTHVSFDEEIDDDYIDSLLGTLIPKKDKGDDFFDSTTREIAKTLILLVCYLDEYREKRNFIEIARLFNLLFTDKDDSGMSELDRKFEELELQLMKKEGNSVIPHVVLDTSIPASVVVERWKNVQAMVKGSETSDFLASVRGSFSVYFTRFLTSNVKRIMEKDSMLLDRIGEKDSRISWWIKTNESSRNYDYISSLFYTAVFQMILFNAQKNKNHRLSKDICMFIDEGGSAYVNSFDTIISTCRKKGLILICCYQSIYSQLETLYGKEKAETIVSNFAIKIYISVDSSKSQEEFIKLTGQTTIDLKTRSRSSKSESTSLGENIQPLINVNDLNNMKPYTAFVLIDGDVYCDRLQHYEKMKEYKKYLKSIENQ